MYYISAEDAEFTIFLELLGRQVTGAGIPILNRSDRYLYPDIFSNLNKLLRTIITKTSCSVETLFTAEQIKTHLRASMYTTCLNNLPLLTYERDLCDSLDCDEIISVFNTQPRRLHVVL